MGWVLAPNLEGRIVKKHGAETKRQNMFLLLRSLDLSTIHSQGTSRKLNEALCVCWSYLKIYICKIDKDQINNIKH